MEDTGCSIIAVLGVIAFILLCAAIGYGAL